MSGTAKQRFLQRTSAPLPAPMTSSHIQSCNCTSAINILQSELAYVKQRLDDLSSPSLSHIPSSSRSSHLIPSLSSAIQSLQKSHILVDRSLSSQLAKHLVTMENMEQNIVSALRDFRVGHDSSKSREDHLLSQVKNQGKTIDKLQTQIQQQNDKIEFLTRNLQSFNNRVSSMEEVVLENRNVVNHILENFDNFENVDESEQVQIVQNHRKNSKDSKISKEVPPRPESSRSEEVESTVFKHSSVEPITPRQRSLTFSDGLDSHNRNHIGSHHRSARSKSQELSDRLIDSNLDVDVSLHDTKNGSKFLVETWKSAPTPFPVTSLENSKSLENSNARDECRIEPIEGPLKLDSTPKLPVNWPVIVPQSNLTDRRKKKFFGVFSKSTGVRNPVLERKSSGNS
ncbi:hypothetical protein GEMRC1_010796 [Eukaryota sp. GEM-RC1]